MTWFWVLVGLFVLGLMVLVHEWGHFIVAKMLGVRVDVFSIGFGPRIFGWRRGPTDYRVSVLPLGGYVRMAGDNPSEEREGAPDEFLSQPRWSRALIVFAGPATNVVVAVLLLAGLYAVRFEKPAFLDEPARLESVTPDSPAARAGLQAGDLIVEIAGVRNPTWEKVQVETLLGGKESLAVTVRRGDEEFTVEPDRRIFGSLRLRHFGPRPLIEDASVLSKSTTIWNGEIGAHLSSRVRLAVELFNLFDSDVADIDYFYTSRLPGEPLEGVEGIHTHPSIPRMARVSLQVSF